LSAVRPRSSTERLHRSSELAALDSRLSLRRPASPIVAGLARRTARGAGGSLLPERSSGLCIRMRWRRGRSRTAPIRCSPHVGAAGTGWISGQGLARACQMPGCAVPPRGAPVQWDMQSRRPGAGHCRHARPDDAIPGQANTDALPCRNPQHLKAQAGSFWLLILLDGVLWDNWRR
jgi:hypothetical protein